MMKRSLSILLVGIFITLPWGCNDDEESPRGVFTIANLEYSPKTVPLKAYWPTVDVMGTLTFTNAQGGISKFRLLYADQDLAINVEGVPQSSGQLIAGITFENPAEATTYPFKLWLIDGKGNSSNTLEGTIEIFIDDHGTNWFTIMLSSTYQPVNVLWGNSKFIATGYGGSILTSPDGVSWIAQNSKTGSLLQGAVWSGTQYVVVGEYNTILTSPDGVEWTVRSSGSIDEPQLKSVAWSGNLFVAVGYSMSNETVILTSENGIIWTTNDFKVDKGTLHCITWSGNQFVAVGGSVEQGTLILTSPDGLAWTDRSPSEFVSDLYDVIWTGTKFIAVGGSLIATSTDGTSWVGTINSAVSLFGITYSGNTFLGVGDHIYTSPDGITWTKTMTNQTGYTLNSAAWSGTGYVVVGDVLSVLISP